MHDELVDAVEGLGGVARELAGEAGTRGRLYGWLLDTNELGLLSDLDASDWSKLAETRALLDVGDLAGARAKLAEIDLDTVDLVSRLLDPLIERGKQPLDAALAELRAARGAMDELVGGDVLGDLEIVTVHRSKLGAAARGGAEVRIELDTPDGTPRLTVLVDEAADAKVLREELLHVAEILYGDPAHRTWWSELTEAKLAGWGTKPTLDKLKAREAYLELEAVNNARVMESYPDADALDEDQLLSLASARDHDVENRRELAAVRRAKADAEAGLTPKLDGIALDEPPRLTGRRFKPADRWEELAGAAAVPQIEASFKRLVATLGTDVTPSTRIRSGWRRRVDTGIAGEVELVQVGGVVRFKKGDVNAAAADPDAWATYADLPGWSTRRDDLSGTLLEAVAAAAPELEREQVESVVGAMLAAMEESPIGFVYGTTPLRVYGYADGYAEHVVPGGVFRAGDDIEELHHLTPLYLFASGQLDLTTIPGIGPVATKLVDLDAATHDAVHAWMSSIEIDAPSGKTTLAPDKLQSRFWDRLAPGAAVIDDKGGMSWYSWDKDTSAFNKLYPP